MSILLSGVGLGMLISATGGAIGLWSDARRNAKKSQAESGPVTTHYHIKIDEDSYMPEFVKAKAIAKPPLKKSVSDDFIKSILDAPPVDRTYDWKAAFTGAAPIKEEKSNVNEGTESPRNCDSKGDVPKVSPSRARTEKRLRKDRKKD